MPAPTLDFEGGGVALSGDWLLLDTQSAQRQRLRKSRMRRKKGAAAKSLSGEPWKRTRHAGAPMGVFPAPPHRAEGDPPAHRSTRGTDTPAGSGSTRGESTRGKSTGQEPTGPSPNRGEKSPRAPAFGHLDKLPIQSIPLTPPGRKLKTLAASMQPLLLSYGVRKNAHPQLRAEARSSSEKRAGPPCNSKSLGMSTLAGTGRSISCFEHGETWLLKTSSAVEKGLPGHSGSTTRAGQLKRTLTLGSAPAVGVLQGISTVGFVDGQGEGGIVREGGALTSTKRRLVALADETAAGSDHANGEVTDETPSLPTAMYTGGSPPVPMADDTSESCIGTGSTGESSTEASERHSLVMGAGNASSDSWPEEYHSSYSVEEAAVEGSARSCTTLSPGRASREGACSDLIMPNDEAWNGCQQPKRVQGSDDFQRSVFEIRDALYQGMQELNRIKQGMIALRLDAGICSASQR